MSLLTRRRLILAKLESSYGVDPTPTGSANAILVKSLNFNPINATLVQRDLIRPFFGNSDTLLAEVNVTMDFEVELAGAGVPGLAPGWGDLMKACGMVEQLNTAAIAIARTGTTATATLASHGFTSGSKVTISGATETEYNGTFVISNVTTNTFDFTVAGSPATPATGSPVVGTTAVYTPISTSIPSMTFYVSIDGVLHKVTGARGTFELSLATKAIPTIKFTFTGLYADPSDTTAPTVDYSKFQAPRVANTQNTVNFSLFGYAGALESLTLNMANDIQYRSLIGEQTVDMVDRKPSGTMIFEAPTMAQKDFFSVAQSGTTGVMALTHGVVSGNIVSVNAGRVTLGNPTYQDSQGIQMLSAPFTAAPVSGNDELTLTVA